MQSWIASGLGFALNHIEEAFGVLFDLEGQPDEYVEFDTAALLRLRKRNALRRWPAVCKEAFSRPMKHAIKKVSTVKFGDELRVQQQVVRCLRQRRSRPRHRHPLHHRLRRPETKGHRDDIKR